LTPSPLHSAPSHSLRSFERSPSARFAPYSDPFKKGVRPPKIGENFLLLEEFVNVFLPPHPLDTLTPRARLPGALAPALPAIKIMAESLRQTLHGETKVFPSDARHCVERN
jgi:hypothetical protein